MAKDSPSTDTRMGHYKRNAIILLLFVGFSTLGAFFLVRNIVGSWLGPSMITADRIGMASILVMQMDSFLAAGYVIGFFQSHAQESKMIQTLSRLNDQELLKRREEKGTEYFPAIRFLMSMLVIGFFVLSGLYAVRSTLFETRDELEVSLTFLVQGAMLMVAFWFTMISEAESMAELTGRLRSQHD
jgi:hypothetical protein